MRKGSHRVVPPAREPDGNFRSLVRRRIISNHSNSRSRQSPDSFEVDMTVEYPSTFAPFQASESKFDEKSSEASSSVWPELRGADKKDWPVFDHTSYTKGSSSPQRKTQRLLPAANENERRG